MATIAAKSVRPGQGLRASWDKNARPTGLGGGTVTGEATEAVALPE